MFIFWPVAAIVGLRIVPASAFPAPEHVPMRGDSRDNRTAALAIAAYGGTPRSNRGGHKSHRKNFLVMTLAPLKAVIFLSFFRRLYLRL
jgi:hypothetical protein